MGSGAARIERPGRRGVESLRFPLREFVHAEASGGVLLLLCAVAALVWANSPWDGAYADLWATRLTIGPGDAAIGKPLGLWINDGLMAVFFFVVGLEIKREVLVGELASLRQAALPIAAALGGMAMPALIFVAINVGGDGARGWGVPMATDIAFALGILALLGDRVPAAIKIFLTALAIVDDLGAVLVIALFYTAEVTWAALGAAGLFLIALLVANRLHVRRPVVYAVLGAGLWVAFLKSGVHATIAGVLLAATIPARTRIDGDVFLARGQALLDEFEHAGRDGHDLLTNGRQQAVVQELEAACEAVETPLQRLEHALHPWVAFVIMPLFALANAGVVLDGGAVASLGDRVALGVVLGLVIGKQVGVVLFAWLAVRAGVTSLPDGVAWRQLYGAAWLAGIGFTMSLFIAELAFVDAALLAEAKLGILVASLLAGIGGALLLRRGDPDLPAPGSKDPAA